MISLPGPIPTPLLSPIMSDVRRAFGEPGFWGTGGGAIAEDVRRE